MEGSIVNGAASAATMPRFEQTEPNAPAVRGCTAQAALTPANACLTYL